MRTLIAAATAVTFTLLSHGTALAQQTATLSAEQSETDETVLVGDLIPELQPSAFGDATVRQVMEMTTALKYSEDYADPNAEVWTYAEAGSPLPKPEGYDGPRSYFEFLQTVKKQGVHGQTIWIDPSAEMVIVRFASHPVAANAANDPTSLPAYRAVADYLMEQDAAPQLIGRGWQIEKIADQKVIENSAANLLFLPDGSLAGNSTCNRLVGNFTQTDKQLSFQSVGSTKMMCSPEEMQQEQSLMELLPKIETFDFDQSGALILKSDDGTTITARRR